MLFEQQSIFEQLIISLELFWFKVRIEFPSSCNNPSCSTDSILEFVSNDDGLTVIIGTRLFTCTIPGIEIKA